MWLRHRKEGPMTKATKPTMTIAHDMILARAEACLPVKICFQYDSFEGTLERSSAVGLVFTAQRLKNVNLSFILDLESVVNVVVTDEFRIYMKVDFEDGNRLPFH